MSIFADCDICGILGPCELIDGRFLCDSCLFDYLEAIEESDENNYCDGNCVDCNDWEDCENHYF